MKIELSFMQLCIILTSMMIELDKGTFDDTTTFAKKIFEQYKKEKS